TPARRPGPRRPSWSGARRPPSSTGQELRQLLAEALRDQSTRVRIAVANRAQHRACLLEGDVRRQRWHLRIDDRLDERRTVRGERAVPRVADEIRILDADAFQAQ